MCKEDSIEEVEQIGRFPRIYVIMEIACNFLEVASIPLMQKNTTLPL